MVTKPTCETEQNNEIDLVASLYAGHENRDGDGDKYLLTFDLEWM
jgi:hypothetical protein